MESYQTPDPSPGPHVAPGNHRQAVPLRSRPLKFQHFLVTFPQDQVVQVTLNRPDKLNCVDKATSREIAEVWEAFDQDESLLVGVITGVGRAFCTGADLHEWNEMVKSGVVNDMGAPGLAGLPRRGGKKPIIAAVNGICMGGGFEMAANCDLVVASSSAVFALSEARRGIVPVAGSLPRLASTIGVQRTTELALTGRSVGADVLHAWGLVSQVVAVGDGDDDQGGGVVGAALRLAAEICNNSPDAVIVGRLGIRMAWETGNVEEAVTALAETWYPRLVKGPNFAEGIQAFAEKRPPRWVGSKL
ncbi:putative secondary metabolism biosynthetic enzyme [Diaporthe australafricana]|uniref:Secondary metabolism biosynthetic enzyme n=1 Tax=Diaporthe australafricana TaxID=127596 RepID=A0ABR3W927_9PEZI